MNNQRQRLRKKAFSLVELLVVFAIVGSLAALLFPAIQAARESARRAQCSNNLKQISLGVLNHEQALGHFPYGGWGHEWVGVAGRGSKEQQPGGWVYNALPYLELSELHSLGGDPKALNADRHYSQRLGTPVRLFTCPTRRPSSTWMVSDGQAYLSQPKPAGNVSEVARGDYAINAGARSFDVFSFPGPVNFEQGDNPPKEFWPNAKLSSGICHLRFGVGTRRIEDGMSNTYLVGEKFLNPDHYADGESRGDNETLYSGYCTDLHRFTRIDLLPLQDTSAKLDSRGYLRFGSAHPTGYQMALCDGSVRLISYEIAAEAHYRFGHRSDQGIKVASSP